MALACKCDRCGKFFNVGADCRVDKIRIASCFIDTNLSNPKNIKEFDVCSSCSEQFTSWVNKYKSVGDAVLTVNKEESK